VDAAARGTTGAPCLRALKVTDTSMSSSSLPRMAIIRSSVICVGSAEVAIHIAAAADQLQIAFFHFRASFDRLSLSRIRSTSICGVLLPDFDFSSPDTFAIPQKSGF
jgi:hypothetical protein